MNGGSGSDTALGGVGDDTFIVDTSSDLLRDAAGEGSRDVVRSNVTAFSLPLLQLDNEIERAITNTAAGAATLIGNEHGNTLGGNGFDNSLSGGSGDDSLNGCSGADWLAKEAADTP